MWNVPLRYGLGLVPVFFASLLILCATGFVFLVCFFCTSTAMSSQNISAVLSVPTISSLEEVAKVVKIIWRTEAT